jgi:hypothetical protein
MRRAPSGQIPKGSFTVTSSTLESVIETSIGVGRPIGADISEKELKDFSSGIYPTNAIWDTGATKSVITKAVAKALGLRPISFAKVRGVHGAQTVPVMLVSITLPTGLTFGSVLVTECDELSAGCGVLLGMDIICTGDLAISNHNGQTTMSFRTPSRQAIDFTEEDRPATPSRHIYISRLERRDHLRTMKKRKA